MNINKKSSKGIAILLALNLMGSVMCPDYAWALRRMAAAAALRIGSWSRS